MSPLITAGKYVIGAAQWLNFASQWALQSLLAIFLVLLLARFIVDKLDLNPFGRLAYWVRRPTNQWFYEIKSSQFFFPLKQALGFDPTWILLALAAVLFLYLFNSLLTDVIIFLQSLGITLQAFGMGNFGQGIWALIGTVLLGVIYFLMALMTILVIYSWFGLFDRLANWAGRRIYPLLNSLDSSGRLGPFAFLIAFMLLGFAASAVQSAFF